MDREQLGKTTSGYKPGPGQLPDNCHFDLERAELGDLSKKTHKTKEAQGMTCTTTGGAGVRRSYGLHALEDKTEEETEEDILGAKPSSEEATDRSLQKATDAESVVEPGLVPASTTEEQQHGGMTVMDLFLGEQQQQQHADEVNVADAEATSMKGADGAAQASSPAVQAQDPGRTWADHSSE